MTAFVSAPNVCAARESAVALVEPVTAQSVTGPACCRWTSTNDGRGTRSSRRLLGTPTSLASATSPVRLTAAEDLSFIAIRVPAMEHKVGYGIIAGGPKGAFGRASCGRAHQGEIEQSRLR
jgi:hypothetical protein